MADLEIDHTLLLIALGLLYLPRQWLRWGKRVVKSERLSRHGDSNNFDPSKRREMGDPAVIFKDEFSKLRNYVDLFRAIAGSAVVVGTAYTPSCFRVAAEAPPGLARGVLVLKFVILLGAMLVQLIRYERRLTLFAPIFFVAGLTFGLSGVAAAGFAFLLVWALNLVLPSASAFLTTQAVLILVFGTLLGERGDLFVMAAFFCLFLPVLISMLTGRSLQTFHRRG
ncbi:MAG: hypothetical protein H7343_11915 [Undibacterium sp.]|nr:hypothetical protein [Opitutaceae bacterium]